MKEMLPRRRKCVKKLKAIEETEAKGAELNEAQMLKVAAKEDVKQELVKVDWYINLYKRAQPKWEAPPEEVKVEEPAAVPIDEIVN